MVAVVKELNHQTSLTLWWFCGCRKRTCSFTASTPFPQYLVMYYSVDAWVVLFFTLCLCGCKGNWKIRIQCTTESFMTSKASKLWHCVTTTHTLARKNRFMNGVRKQSMNNAYALHLWWDCYTRQWKIYLWFNGNCCQYFNSSSPCEACSTYHGIQKLMLRMCWWNILFQCGCDESHCISLRHFEISNVYNK